MPKMRSHSGCKKRFKKTSSGKIKRTRSYSRHHGWAKETKQKRQLRKQDYFVAGDAENIARLMPYA